MTKISTLKKPTLSADAVRAFAEGATNVEERQGLDKGPAQAERTQPSQKSGLVPQGDVRLTANIRGDLHLKLKIRAAQERTTVGELIEQWIEGWDK